MATVSRENMVFTVMVRHTVEPKHQKELVNLSKRMLPVFQKQPGLVSLNVHRSLDGTQALTYLQWRSEADHEACRASPEVAAAGSEFTKFIESGRSTIEVQTYQVVASSETP